MGFIYQEANAYGVEALVALERHYTPTEEKYCTAVTEAVRICDTYGIRSGSWCRQVPPYRRRRGVPAGAPVRGRGDAAIPVHSSLRQQHLSGMVSGLGLCSPRRRKSL